MSSKDTGSSESDRPNDHSNRSSPLLRTEASDPDPTPNERGPAPRGKCKFDGTDYPDWLPFNPFKKPEEPFTFPFPKEEGDPWAKAAKLVKNYDDGMCTEWVEEIQNILLFAGLFSAVVTAFAIETQKLLRPDPAAATVLMLAQLLGQMGNSTSLGPINDIASPFQNNSNTTQSLRINVFVYLSLMLSLGTALVGIIAMQWIRSYRRYESQSHKDHLALRHIRYQSLIQGSVPEIISALPLILQAALIIFFAGLIDFLYSLNSIVTITISTLIGAIVFFVLFTTVAPGVSIIRNPFFLWKSRGSAEPPPHSPYESPQSWAFVQFVFLMKRTYHFIYSILTRQQSHRWRDHTSHTAHLMMGASNWSQLASAHAACLADDGLLGSSLGWIFKGFTDTESFCSLFNCFQTLGVIEMGSTLKSILGASDRRLAKLVHSTEKVGEEERKQLFLLLLIDWIKRQRYWHHSGIGLHGQELMLRSMAYSVTTAPAYSNSNPSADPSSTPVWKSLMLTSESYTDYPSDSLEMQVFWALVLLRGSSSPSFEHDSQRNLSPEMIYRLMFSIRDHLRPGSNDLIDDVLLTFGNWLENWQSRNPDEEVHSAWQQDILKGFIIGIESWFVQRKHENRELFQRPAFISVLDHLSNHPKGQQSWKNLTPELAVDDWDNAFVEHFLEDRYSALIYNHQRVRRLVDGRENRLVACRDINGSFGVGILEANDNLNEGPSDYPQSAGTMRSTATSNTQSSCAITVTNTILHSTQTYTGEGPDIELGLGLSSELQGAFVKAALR